MNTLHWLDSNGKGMEFPNVEKALRDPDGLLAIGGDLTVPRLLHAYRNGIFPWYSEGQPILWWSPDPRTILLPERIHVSRSLRKTLRQGRFTISVNRAFDAVVAGCAGPRRTQDGTWITREMRSAYHDLNEVGYAHSIEVWQDGGLAGGLYGVSIGRAFFGESMFSLVADASKVALVWIARQLCKWPRSLIDCQTPTEHLLRMGAERVPRSQFIESVRLACDCPGPAVDWHKGLGPAATQTLVQAEGGPTN